jgi:hypothetical protein
MWRELANHAPEILEQGDSQQKKCASEQKSESTSSLLKIKV